MILEKEKRSHSRIDFNQLVRVESYEGNILQLIGINYSLSGIALNCPRPLPLSEFVEVNFRINSISRQEYSVTAEVVQNRRHSNMYIAGLRFLGEIKNLN